MTNNTAKSKSVKKSVFDMEEELINKYPNVGQYYKVIADAIFEALGHSRYDEIKDKASNMADWSEDKGYCLLASMSENEKIQVLNSALEKSFKSTKKSQPTSKSFNDMVKAQRSKNKGIKKDSENEDILRYRQVNIDALQMMIDTLEEAIESIEMADTEALHMLNAELMESGDSGYIGMFLLGGSEADLDGIIEQMQYAIEYCKNSQRDYENGEYDW